MTFNHKNKRQKKSEKVISNVGGNYSEEEKQSDFYMLRELMEWFRANVTNSSVPRYGLIGSLHHTIPWPLHGVGLRLSKTPP